MKVRNASSERGAALLIVLLLVATISVLALSIVQAVSTAYNAALVSSSRSQVLWFAFGAEDLASTKLSALSKVSEGKITSQTPGLNQPLTFDLPGGQLHALFQDASNCFNLNSLAQTSEEAEAAGAISAEQYYKDFLVAVGFDTSQSVQLTAALQDWLDLDNQPRSNGAETSYYATLETPYASGNTLLVSETELRAVKGYSQEVFRRIRPYVCARPDKVIGLYNVNTLRPAHAPLLVPVFANEINAESLENELRAVEGVEFDSASSFLEIQAFAAIAPDKRLDELLGVSSNYFRLTGEVVYLDAVTSYEAVFARSKANEVELLRRRLGVDE